MGKKSSDMHRFLRSVSVAQLVVGFATVLSNRKSWLSKYSLRYTALASARISHGIPLNGEAAPDVGSGKLRTRPTPLSG